MTRDEGRQSPESLAAGDVWEGACTLEQPGEAWAALTLAAPGTSWERGEVAVAALDVDGRDRQEIILAGGEDPVEYVRLLGRLDRGPHRVRLWIDGTLSAPAATVTLSRVHTGSVPDADPAAFIWRHAPVLHYRALESRLDSLATDTPLLLFYRPVAGAPGTGIEYHVVFSHEDEGTDLPGLLARWGHTTDIEWVYRVVRDHPGKSAREEFQGPGHRATPFHGDRALGAHPVLQVATRNGMVTDRVRCPFRAALAPALAQPADEPREGILQRFPWIYRVSALEVRRQLAPGPARSPNAAAPADLRSYLFLEWKRPPGDTGPLEAGVRVQDAWYTSAGGRADLAFRGADAESTAVRLPPGAGETDITAVAVRAFVAPAAAVELKLVRAFLLDETYRPRRPLAAAGTARVTEAETWVTAWARRGTRSRERARTIRRQARGN